MTAGVAARAAVFRMRWPCIALWLLALHGGGSAQERKPIFRHISIQPCGRIELGARFRSILRAVRQNDSTFRLIPQCFGDAEQILVHVSPHMLVTSFDFAYAAGDSLAVFVAEYRQSLGPPISVDTSGQGEHTVVWRDAHTMFTLLRRKAGATVRTYARLADRR